MSARWPTPSTARQRGGKRAQAAGQAWERKLNTLHLYLRPLGVEVSRCHPPVRVGRKDGELKSVSIVGDGPPDYHATVNGRAVVFDAKHTDGDSWALENLEYHQAQALDQHQAAGAVCFIALEHRHQGYVLPWRSLGPLWWAWWNTPGRAPNGTACLSSAQIARVSIALPFDPVYGWLTAVKALIAGAI